MLCQLSIKNIALIDSLTIEFGSGFNVLTGETGAGKSIVIDSMNLALGERADRDLIRAGEERASVEALFDVENCAPVLSLLEENGIECDGGQMIVSRVLTSSGRNIVRINGTLVPLTLLKSVTSALVDVHGQHEHQYLLDESRHLGFLDTYAKHNIDTLKQEVAEAYHKYVTLRTRLRGINNGTKERAQRLDMLSYQVAEIKKARLKMGEEESLAEQRELMRNSERIAEALQECVSLLDGQEDSDTPGSTDAIRQTVSLLSGISRFSSAFENLENQLRDVYYTLEDLAMQVHVQADQMEFDPKLQEQVENRLEEIKNLKRKYGGSIGEILKYQSDAEKEIEQLSRQEQDSGQLDKKFAEISKKLYDLCINLHEKRVIAGEAFSKAVEKQLNDLGMKNAHMLPEFAPIPAFEEAEAFYSATGLDRVRFLLSVNPGEPVKPLSRTASGGELSRIMLAFKAIAADQEDVGTMVFDEIDTGISGRMAQVVGEKMALIGKAHQVICVTHLPQIAALGKHHHLVEKSTDGTRTNTDVRTLSVDERVQELARMVGGVTTTEATLSHAREMLSQAAELTK